MKVTKKLKDKDIVQEIAKKEGLCHTNTYYRDVAKREYKRDISPSTVVKSIGPLSVRLRHDEKSLISIGKLFLKDMSGSLGLAQYILVKSAIKENTKEKKVKSFKSWLNDSGDGLEFSGEALKLLEDFIKAEKYF